MGRRQGDRALGLREEDGEDVGLVFMGVHDVDGTIPDQPPQPAECPNVEGATCADLPVIDAETAGPLRQLR